MTSVSGYTISATFEAHDDMTHAPVSIWRQTHSRCFSVEYVVHGNSKAGIHNTSLSRSMTCRFFITAHVRAAVALPAPVTHGLSIRRAFKTSIVETDVIGNEPTV